MIFIWNSNHVFVHSFDNSDREASLQEFWGKIACISSATVCKLDKTFIQQLPQYSAKQHTINSYVNTNREFQHFPQRWGDGFTGWNLRFHCQHSTIEHLMMGGSSFTHLHFVTVKMFRQIEHGIESPFENSGSGLHEHGIGPLPTFVENSDSAYKIFSNRPPCFNLYRSRAGQIVVN